MRRTIARLGVGAAAVVSSAGLVLLACEDSVDLPSGTFDLDTGTPSLPVLDATTAVDATAEVDAGPVDAGPPDELAPFLGIWRGRGYQPDTNWTILLDVHGGPRGELVGVMTYPSLACAGTLARLEDVDGGLDAGPIDSGVDGGTTLTLRETVSAGTCVPIGDDLLTVLPDGGLGFAWRPLGSDVIEATGTLSRVGTRQASSDKPLGIWSSGTPDTQYRWPLLATVSRIDEVGSPVGVFARAVTGEYVCAGLWTLTAAAPGRLEVAEVYADENMQCPPAGAVTLTLETDGGLAALRDGGQVTLEPR